MTKRRNCREVFCGKVGIGGKHPVSIQSMLNAPAHDIEANVAQAQALKAAGCDIVRVAVPDREAMALIPAIKEKTGLPVVADIHFDYRLALEAVAAGADKIRINPGNIGSDDRIKAVADACAQKGIPIRVGVNSGSVEKSILAKYGRPSADAMCESALHNVRMLEKFNFNNIVISIKSTDVADTVQAYEKIAGLCDYPLHIGITEAGTLHRGVIKSAVGLGALLLHGIGDTVRVSLTDDPVREVEAARDILNAAGVLHDRPEIVSCPTCGRTKINVIGLAEKVEKRLSALKVPLKVAVMGCAVNGPGEAREADIGVAGGDGYGLLFKKGEILRKVPEDRLFDELIKEISDMTGVALSEYQI